MKTLISLPPVRLRHITRGDLRRYVANAWEIEDTLFRSIVQPDAMYRNPDPRRHPLIFYLGHTAVFYVNKLRLAGLLDQGMDEPLERQLAVGVDPETAAHLEAPRSWPLIDEVRAYRSRTFERILALIESVPIPPLVRPADPLWALLMGIEHQRIHFETSSVLIRQMPVSALTRPQAWQYAPAGDRAPPTRMIDMPPGTTRIGKPADVAMYGWDNEYGQLKKYVKPFTASSLLITNRDMLEMVESGGYRTRALWTDEGWAWVREHGIAHPPFWIDAGGGFRYRAMFDVLDMPLDWPVEVTCHEALAYCRWRGHGWRLPREAEVRRISADARLQDDDCVLPDCYNNNLRFGSPCAVGAMPGGATPRGFCDVYGNVWEHMSDDFYPLPGFEAHPLYEDFSAPYFDDQHAMMLGGSWASTGTSASRYYRLWFRRDFVQHCGFRVARDLA